MKVKVVFDNENQRYKIFNGDTVINANEVTVNEIPIDSELSDTSANAVENKVITEAINSNKAEIKNRLNTLTAMIDSINNNGLNILAGSDFSWNWNVSAGSTGNFKLPANTVCFIVIPNNCLCNILLNDSSIYEFGDITATETQVGFFVTPNTVTDSDNFRIGINANSEEIKTLVEANTTLLIADSPNELKDIRVDYYGKTWGSAGDAVRSILDKLNNYFYLTNYNLLNPDNSIRGNMSMTGVVTESESSTYFVSDYIKVEQGEVYAFTYDNQTYNSRYALFPNRLCFFDTDKTFTQQSTSVTDNDYYKTEAVNVAGVSHTSYYKYTAKANGYIRLLFGTNLINPQVALGEVYEYINYFAPNYLLKDKKIEENNLSQALQDKINNGADPIYKFNYCKLHAKALFVGDSLTEGYRASGDIRKDKSYPAYASKLMNCEYLNNGVSGITTLGWWQTYGDTVDFTEYDAMFIYLGTNGGLTDTVEEDTASGDYHTYADTNTGAYCAIIAKALDVNPNIKIYVVKYGTTTVSNITQDIADKYGVPTILVTDTRYFTLTDSFYHTDNTHYNTVGYWALANVLMIQVEEYIKNHLADYKNL